MLSPLSAIINGRAQHDGVNANAPSHQRPTPTPFQKTIDIILRLQSKSLLLDPPDMLRRASPSSLLAPTNHMFAGWELVEENLFLSLDKDELFIRITANDDQLLEYAAKQGIYLNTHPYSFAGGAPLVYSRAMDEDLHRSVDSFLTVYPESVIASASAYSVTAKGGASGARNATTRGFILEAPDRSRLTVRLIRESLRFGGCGIQIAEMKKRKTLVRNFFPLHSSQHSERLNLHQWGSLMTMFSTTPLLQDNANVVEYFGEEVALYFLWIVKFTKTLIPLAAIGFVCGIISSVAKSTNSAGSTQDVAGGLFSFACVLWGVGWNIRWLRCEQAFAVEHGQDAQMSQELVRDEFEPTGEEPVAPTDIFNMKFDVPLTLRRLADGSLVNLTSNKTRRLLMRYAVAYPIILLLTAAMLTVMVLLTYWRFQNPDSNVVSYASSALSIVASSGFGWIFDFAAEKFNSMENNRTESEEAAQVIGKNFFFNFFSKFFTLLTIMLWPADVGSRPVDDAERLDQIEAQMLVVCVVKPMVQNIQEIVLPIVMTQLRIRRDFHGGSTFRGLVSLVTREEIATERVQVEAHNTASVSREERGRSLWLEAQMEPYESTRGDYLEITLQFGFMTMFAATFPWSAVAALVYNIMEVRVDAWKLLNYHQRPMARPANTIGAWNAISFFIVCVALATNGYLIAIMGRFRDAIDLNADSDSEKYQFFAAVQYVWLVCIFFLFATVSRNSSITQKIKAKQALLTNFATRKRISGILKSQYELKAGTGVLSRSDADPRMFDVNEV
ncbi:Hypothetical protein, putative [Bodo saltans]|uniref:Anoctamin transmembrane domain-containing protein n=1 Tax=Bodo saltans TaxID=75058 RepID=A0A0S4IHF5_BODSA|nr:Hypothetical protein, putative [Bodo saltans]|eukprot:CUE63962.1 Hypothetical protein, putative [Bodo saltans]